MLSIHMSVFVQPTKEIHFIIMEHEENQETFTRTTKTVAVAMTFLDDVTH